MTKSCAARGSLIGLMPGDTWQKYANLRLPLGYMWREPGLHLPAPDEVRGGAPGGTAAPHFAKTALHELDFDSADLDWIDANDSDQCTLSFVRRACSRGDTLHPERSGAPSVAVALHFTPLPATTSASGIARRLLREILNADARRSRRQRLVSLGGSCSRG